MSKLGRLISSLMAFSLVLTSVGVQSVMAADFSTATSETMNEDDDEFIVDDDTDSEFDDDEDEDEVEDEEAPTISGVVHGGCYNKDVTIRFSDNVGIANAFLNNVQIKNGYTVSKEGEYVVQVYDVANNSTQCIFTIDKTPPLFNFFKSFLPVGTVIDIPDDDDDCADIRVNGVVVKNDYIKFNKEGSYTVVAYDEAGNKAEKKVIVDSTSPILIGIKSGLVSKPGLKLVPKDANGVDSMTVNGLKKTSGYKLSVAGNYKIVLKDQAGNTGTYSIVIDSTKPKITGVKNGKSYKKSAKVKVSDSNLKKVTLDGKSVSLKKIKSGYKVNKKGRHKVVATDKAGNKKTVTFKIKK